MLLLAAWSVATYWGRNRGFRVEQPWEAFNHIWRDRFVLFLKLSTLHSFFSFGCFPLARFEHNFEFNSEGSFIDLVPIQNINHLCCFPVVMEVCKSKTSKEMLLVEVIIESVWGWQPQVFHESSQLFYFDTERNVLDDYGVGDMLRRLTCFALSKARCSSRLSCVLLRVGLAVDVAVAFVVVRANLGCSKCIAVVRIGITHAAEKGLRWLMVAWGAEGVVARIAVWIMMAYLRIGFTILVISECSFARKHGVCFIHRTIC